MPFLFGEDLSITDTPSYQEHDTISSVKETQDSGHKLSISQSQKYDNELAVSTPNRDLANASTLFPRLNKLDKIAHVHTNEFVVSQVSEQQPCLPAPVATIPNNDIETGPAGGNAHGTDAITPSSVNGPDTSAAALASDSEDINPPTLKAADEKLAITSAMEAHANITATMPLVKVGIIEAEASPAPTPKVYSESFLSSATRLKQQILETDELIVCPGVYDGFSARIALSVGFSALYMVRVLGACLFHLLKNT